MSKLELVLIIIGLFIGAVLGMRRGIRIGLDNEEKKHA